MPLPTVTRVNAGDPEALARTEWLLTSGSGGFAMGTALGAPSRRYHGLLIAALRPPVKRVMALSTVAETVSVDPGTDIERRMELSCFRFRPGVLHPHGDQFLEKFEKDTTARWTYRAGPVSVVKTVQLLRESPAVAVRYAVRWADATTPPRALRLSVRPLVSLRDFHALVLRDTGRDRLSIEPLGTACNVHSSLASLYLGADRAVFQPGEQWWFDFQYEHERDRGYDYIEDLLSPGTFIFDLPASTSEQGVTLYASTVPGPAKDLRAELEGKTRRLEEMVKTTRQLMRIPEQQPRPEIATLVSAADDFVVRRIAPQKVTDPQAQPEIYTILAGYPWFSDWGRDAMIALPGLLLTTGRYHEAGDVLTTFASACRGGLIPNVFDDYTGQPHYNTVDASLWFVHACVQHLRATGDHKLFQREYLPACQEIVSAYRAGTSFDIAMDPEDGLVCAGTEGTQLTWMDAKRDGVVFTPRHGKPVEINALWYNALLQLAGAIKSTHPGLCAELRTLAQRVGASIRAKFWNAQRGCLHDVLVRTGEGWSPDASVRPNQLLAVSLPHSALSDEQKSSVVRVCTDVLGTPHGVRTLEPGDGRYRGRYGGRMFERDAAYHNGTAWPWLLGPLAEATIRAGAFSPVSLSAAETILAPIVADLQTGQCPGTIAEVFDADDEADAPQRPGGCPAQAWSVAEILRVLGVISRARAGERDL